MPSCLSQAEQLGLFGRCAGVIVLLCHAAVPLGHCGAAVAAQGCACSRLCCCICSWLCLHVAVLLQLLFCQCCCSSTWQCCCG